MKQQPIIVVGGGLAGLMTALKVAELGWPVRIFSIVPVKRSHSVCAQGGINAAKNIKGEGDHPDIHFDDTIYGGDFLANQPPVKAMCYEAPKIIDLFDRMGVPFNRTPEGNLDFRRFGGTLYHRTAFAQASTGQQLMYALDEQVRRYEAEGLVEKFEFWEFLHPVLNDKGEVIGITAIDLKSMKIEAFPAAAVVMATGGPGLLYGRSTNSIINTGAAAARCYEYGARYANGEFIQIHPTAIPGKDKLRLISESVRGEGGRVWVPRKKGDTRHPNDIPESERWYFLEEKYPAYGNLVPRDIATREIFMVCRDGYGVRGEWKVYLDVTHLPREVLDKKLANVLEIYEKFRGVDPREEPMEVFPAVHYSMGGLWVDNYKDMTNLPGLFAAGEVNYQYHGANRLGANSLLSCLFDGIVSGPAAVEYAGSRTDLERDYSSVFATEVKKHEEEFNELAHREGSENAFQLHQELGELMTRYVSVIRKNSELEEALAEIRTLRERWQNLDMVDRSGYSNQYLTFAYALKSMLNLAEVVTKGALLRQESRGAHYKVDTPERDDENWLKTTIATYTQDGPEITYQEVDISLIPPRPRTYGKVEAGPEADGKGEVAEVASPAKPVTKEEEH